MKHYQDRSFIEKYPLSRKKIIKKTITTSLLVVFLGTIVGIFFFLPTIILITQRSAQMLGGSFVIAFLVALELLLIFCTYLYAAYYYKTYFYTMTSTVLIIRKGVFGQQEITIPYGRIQDVYLDQDLLDQILGLYDVHISTATAISGSRAHIDGVTKETAEELRELILQKVHEAMKK